LRYQLRWTPPPHPWRAPISSVTSWAWNDRRKQYYKHLSFVATLSPAAPPPRRWTIHPPFPRCSPSPSAPVYQVLSLSIVTSCIFFPRSSCSIIGAFWLFPGSLCTCVRTPLHVKRSHPSPRGHFYSVLFVVTLDFFYLFGVRCWFCYLCFVVPIAPIPSCFDGRFVILLGSYYITLVVPDRQVIMSGLKVQSVSLLLPHPRSRLVPYDIPSTHLRPVAIFLSILSAYPLSLPLHWPVL
jgi:hypothetical protein